MARIEKTVFISYRRKDISWALAVYQYLTSQKYDVFFDYTSIASGDFEQVIVSNIRARAHFVLILTPTALDRCSQPGDWLCREIETAIDEKRNIIPLFFDGFSFGSPAVTEKLTGKLANINRYNGLDVPAGYFMEAMERLRFRYLNVPLDAVIHPVSAEVRKVVKEEKVAANKALLQKREDIEELVKPTEENLDKPKQVQDKKATESPSFDRRGSRSTPKAIRGDVKIPNLRPYGIGFGILLVAAFGIFGINSLIQNVKETATPTFTQPPPVLTNTSVLPTRTQSIPTNTPTVAPTPVPTLGIGSTIISSKDGMTLLYVPAGEFTMGSDTGNNNEKPVHMVYIGAFWIDQTEVTNAMYAICVGNGECDPPDSAKSYTHKSYYGNPEFDNFPVIYVSWNDANAYCSWADRRLPSEAEWEKAASWDEVKNEKYIYPWGNSIDCSLANFIGMAGVDVCVGDTSSVGSYQDGASPYGALDMAGNVLEWVADWFEEAYYQNIASSNPLGPDSGQYRVMRGGAFGLPYLNIRSTYRFWHEPADSDDSIGFRCAMDASE